MQEKKHTPGIQLARRCILLVLATALASIRPGLSDDRDLVRTSSADPYVFVLFDNTYSMTQDLQGNRSSLYDDGQDSKIYLAKEALNVVLQGTNNVRYGFATFPNFSGYRAHEKQCNGACVGPAWSGRNDNDGGSNQIWCQGFEGNNDDLADKYKGYGILFDTTTNARGLDYGDLVPFDWGDDNVEKIRKRLAPNLALGAINPDFGVADYFNDEPIGAPGGPCSATGGTDLRFSGSLAGWDITNSGTDTLTISRITVTWPWSNGQLYRVYFGGSTIYDPNHPPNSAVIDSNWSGTVPRRRLDPGSTKRLYFRFQNSSRRRPEQYEITVEFEEGCSVTFIPGGAPLEDFLRLRHEQARPFLAWGNTPLAGALSSFKSWYVDWEPEALVQDPQLDAGCRRVFVVLMTDGFETCGGTPVAAAADLYKSLGIPTYVIGFAINNPELDAIALAGGTDSDPDDNSIAHYRADDQQALINAFNSIIQDIKATSRTFASAAVPSVNAQEGNQLFLTSFSPVSSVSVWPGRVDAYYQPLPFTTTPSGTRVPDRRDSARCNGSSEKACRIWSADEELLLQSPTQTDIVAGDLKLGGNINQRRVFYNRENTGEARPLRTLFQYPSAVEDQLDLYGPNGFDLDPLSPDFLASGDDVIERTLVQKRATIEDPVTTAPTVIDYILGDIFHSDPKLVASPNNLAYFSADMSGRVEACGLRIDGGTDLHPPYPCFAIARQHRRKVLLVGANDGQLHAFDAGQPLKATSPTGDIKVEFPHGSGKEIFSFIPRSIMPTVREIAVGGSQEFSVDGTVSVDDVVIDPSFVNFPDPDLRQWRTVAIGGLREGGRGYYALDITQPDKLDQDSIPTSASYVPSCLNGGSGCDGKLPLTGFGPYPDLPYPLPLWEFTDGWDEDGAGAPDLGYTWSQAEIGRIKVLDSSGDVAERYVAIFGGGMDPLFKRNPIDEGDPNDPNDDTQNPQSGNYLYMVDIETGTTIYKRRLDLVGGLLRPAMTPSKPAAVDTNFDSYLDTIYIGTTAGHLFKVDISTPQPLESASVDDWASDNPVTGLPPLARAVERVMSVDWEPFPIFDTEGRAIYFPPSVIFVSELNRYALAFGTGDREDLWSQLDPSGRFYVFLDGGFTPQTANLPFTESKLQAVSLSSSDTSTNFLLAETFDPLQASLRNPGWSLALEPTERLVSKSIGISGVLLFGTYIPRGFIPGQPTCSREGTSQLYAVATSNANALQADSSGNGTVRFRQVDDFVTTPFVETSYTDASPPTDNTIPPEDPCSGMAQLTQSMQASLFPRECSFANYTLNVKTIRSDTGIECVAPIPICIIERNWKEF